MSSALSLITVRPAAQDRATGPPPDTARQAGSACRAASTASPVCGRAHRRQLSQHVAGRRVADGETAVRAGRDPLAADEGAGPQQLAVGEPVDDRGTSRLLTDCSLLTRAARPRAAGRRSCTTECRALRVSHTHDGCRPGVARRRTAARSAMQRRRAPPSPARGGRRTRARSTSVMASTSPESARVRERRHDRAARGELGGQVDRVDSASRMAACAPSSLLQGSADSTGTVRPRASTRRRATPRRRRRW